MFQEFCGFTRLPFSRTIATQDLFPTVGQKELGARLAYLVRERGVGLITGEIGCGKSTAIRAFAASPASSRASAQPWTNSSPPNIARPSLSSTKPIC